MGFLQDKKILITGLLSNRSIAYGIAKAMQARRRRRSRSRIRAKASRTGWLKLAARIRQRSRVCRATSANDAEIDALFAELGARWDGLDGIVHSIAFAPREALAGDFLDGMTREAFRIAHEISATASPRSPRRRCR